MGLARIGNAIARTASGALASACRCCFSRTKYFCEVVRVNLCGFNVYECRQAGTPRPPGVTLYDSPSCDGQCPEADPCCLEQPCGPCQVCLDGVCVPCPAGYICINGVCVPEPPPPEGWYCCFEEAPPEGYSGSNWPGTYCQEGECPEGRHASGPHANSLECDEDCQDHKCEQDNCGGADCVASAAGEHPTRTHCLEACEGIPDDDAQPCVVARQDTGDACPCSYAGGQGTFNYFFSIDPSTRRYAGNTVCVSYVSRSGHPINVSLWAPTLGPNCEVINPRNSQGVSGWRGCAENDCEDERPPGDLEGGPSGRILWLNKQRGIVEFEVQIIAPCEDTEWEVVVLCGECHEFADEPECSPCVAYAAATAPDDPGPFPIGLVPESVKRIRVPDQFDLPVAATWNRGCDDGLAINGQRISFFGQVPPDSIYIDTRTFEAGIWNDGGTWWCVGDFCFAETNPLP